MSEIVKKLFLNPSDTIQTSSPKQEYSHHGSSSILSTQKVKQSRYRPGVAQRVPGS
jgi:hypothetical protein